MNDNFKSVELFNKYKNKLYTIFFILVLSSICFHIWDLFTANVSIHDTPFAFVLNIIFIFGSVYIIFLYNRINSYTSKITEDLATTEKIFEEAIQSSPIGQALVATNGTWLKANQALCDIVGYTEEELLKTDFQSITHEEDLDKDLNYVNKVLSGEIKTYQMEKRYYHKKGYIIWVQLNVSLVRDGADKPLYFISQIQDITEKKQYIEQLIQRNTELDDFAYITSHDLKEPLRGISNYASFLLEDYQDKLNDDGKNKLNTLKKLSKRMEEQLSDLLSYSKITRQEVELQQVDLNQLLVSLIETLNTIYMKDKITIKIIGMLPEIACEKIYINELFTNLIVNGIKYNSSGHKIIEIGCYKKYNGSYVFYVKDNGIGIDEKYKDAVFKIFKIFKRLNSRQKYSDGTGAGLTIAKKIIERHNGAIWFESELNHGTVFYFTLEKGFINDTENDLTKAVNSSS